MMDWSGVLVFWVLMGCLVTFIDYRNQKKREKREDEYLNSRFEIMRETRVADRRYFSEQLKNLKENDCTAALAIINGRLDWIERKLNKK